MITVQEMMMGQAASWLKGKSERQLVLMLREINAQLDRATREKILRVVLNFFEEETEDDGSNLQKL